MPYHLWRIPPVLGVMACCALLLFAAAVSLWLGVRRRSTIARITGAVIFGLLVVLTRLPITAMAAEIARYYQVDFVYARPSRLWYLLPALFACFAFMVGRWVLDDRWISRRALLFYAWLVAFTGANVVNTCTPGWCGRIGLPFPWDTWSDAILTGPADRLSEFMSAAFVVFAAVADLSTFLLVAALLVRPRLLRHST
jgi:hypothetical protein